MIIKDQFTNQLFCSQEIVGAKYGLLLAFWEVVESEKKCLPKLMAQGT